MNEARRKQHIKIWLDGEFKKNKFANMRDSYFEFDSMYFKLYGQLASEELFIDVLKTNGYKQYIDGFRKAIYEYRWGIE